MANQQTYGLFDLLTLGQLNPNASTRTVDADLLVGGILYDLAQHNADIGAVQRLFCRDTTEYQMEVTQQGSGRNQPLDEKGRSLPITPPAPYTVAFPIQGSGSAMGETYLAQQMMTVRDTARRLSAMFRGDYNWVVDHILAGIFTNASYTHRDILGRGSLTVRGPANGDSTTYFLQTTGAAATDTHFLSQSAVVADATNPYPTIKTELLEHPDNDGEVIAFIPTNILSATQGLAEFNSATVDPDIQLGDNTDRLVGSLNAALPSTAVVQGKTDSGVWVVEWPRLPNNYIVAITTGGERPLARRLLPDETLQGFRAAGERNDWPYFEEQWQRYEGYGALNRTGAVVYRVSDGGAGYAVPTNYTSPMP